MKKILVAVDGSQHADHAVRLAADLADKYQAKLIILHTVDKKPLGPEEKHLAEVEFADRLKEIDLGDVRETMQGYGQIGMRGFLRLQDDRNAALKHILGEALVHEAKRVAAEAGDFEIETMVVEGDPAEQIVGTVDTVDANLVVLGSRGLSDLKGLWLGSVSHKVAHLSPVNVVTVR